MYESLILNKNRISTWGLGIGDWAQSPIPNPHNKLLINITYIELVTKLVLNIVNRK